MKRQLSFRFLCVLVALTGTAAVGGHLLHGHQVKRHAGYLLTQSKNALAEKDAPAALRHLSHYLTMRPEDAQARARYGLLQAKQAKFPKQFEQAFLTLERAFRDDPDLVQSLRDDAGVQEELKNESKEVAALANDLLKVRRRTIELAMLLRQFPDAKVHIEVLLRENPNDAETLVLLGRCEEAGGHPALAIEAYSRAKQIEEGRIEAYALLAALYRRTDRNAEADAVMEGLTSGKNAGLVRARLAAIHYFRMNGQVEKARSKYNFDPEQIRGDKDVLLAAIDLDLVEGKETEARQKLRLGSETFPTESQFPFVLAGLELRSGKQAEAVRLLEGVLKLLPKEALSANEAEVVWTVADLMIDARELKQAGDLLKRLRNESSDGAVVDLLEARIHLAEGRAIQAEALLLRCRRGLAKDIGLSLRTELLLSTCYESLGKPDLRLSAAEAANRLEPASVSARMALASALHAAGNTDAAVVAYRQLIEREPTQVVRLTIARAILMQNLQRSVEQRDFTPALDMLDRAPSALKQKADYHLVRAEVLAAEGGKKKLDEARRVIEVARNAFPSDPRFWVFLARIAATTSEEAGLSLLEMARAEAGDLVPFRLARIALLGQKADPAALAAAEAGAEKFSDAERTQLQLGLAEHHLRGGSKIEAERLLRQVLGNRPGDLNVMTRLFDVIATKNNHEEVAELKVKLKQTEGEEGTVWRFAEAYESWLRYRTNHAGGDLRNARIRLAEVIKRRPDWARAHLLMGEIEDREGHPDAAVEHYLRSIRLGIQQPEAVARATFLLTTRGQHEEVRQVLDEFRKKSLASTPGLEQLDALNLVNLGESADEVVRRVEKGVPATSKEYGDHLFRARLYESLTRPKEAEAAYRKAVELNPAASETWVPFIQFLARNKRVEDAKLEIARASAALPVEKKALALGTCYEALGDRAEAEKQFIQAVQEKPNDPVALRTQAVFYIGTGETAKAEPILQTLGVGSGETARWARRTRAITLAASGDYSRGSVGLALVEENLRQDPESPEDLRFRSLILSTRPGGRSQSIKDLEAAFARNQPGPSEDFLLARLYEQEGDWSKANDRFRELLAIRGGDNPAFIAYYIRALLRHGDLPGAATWLVRLEDREKKKDSALLVELRARVRVSQGHTVEATGLLKEYAHRAFKENGNPVVLRSVGLLLAELKLPVPAEEMLKQYVMEAEAKTPAAALVMVEFLARQNRVSQALAICSSALNKVAPEGVARMAVAVVRLGEADSAQYSEAEGIIQRAAQAKPESIDVSISLADLRDAQGRYSEAKKMYQDVLRRDSRSTVAMNNLAWLLALQESNREESLRLINQAISIAGPDGNLLDTRGVIHLTTGDTAQAISDLTSAISQDPLPERCFHLAQAQLKAGNKLEALRMMRKARESELGLEKKRLHRLEWPSYDALNEMAGKQ